MSLDGYLCQIILSKLLLERFGRVRDPRSLDTTRQGFAFLLTGPALPLRRAKIHRRFVESKGLRKRASAYGLVDGAQHKTGRP
jgi:hypothetical protein